MATLYKRYIPPKKPVVAESPATTPAVPEAQPAPVPEQKRKRERTEEEVAERKAKKLKKKKGVDPANVVQPKRVEQKVAADSVKEAAPQPELEAEPEADVKQHAGPQPQGEFAHIKNAKKRHKLEKEARAARKAAQKAGGAAETTATDTQVSQGPDDPTTTPPEQDESIAKKERKKERKSNPGTAGAQGQARDEDVDMEEQPVQTEARVQKTDGLRDDEEPSKEAEAPATGKDDAALPKHKKRRHKLESVLAETQGEHAEQEDDEHLSKHASVISKFQKSAKRSISVHEEESFQRLPTQPVVRDLELPDRERTPTPEFQNENDALPEWLAKPTVVPSDTKATFKDLGLRPEVCDRLAKLTFDSALPVQQTLLPILLQPGTPGSLYPPATEDIVPDLAVSAPTGSGKTMAYLLPIIEALRQSRTPGELSALIIVPTRELVVQVAAVAESLSKGSDIRIGMSGSSGTFGDEQGKIINHGRRYDPAGYKALVAKATSQLYPGHHEDDGDDYVDAKEQQRIDDAVNGLVQHVPTYNSAVNILVATPGRLLEHINNTLGFSLVHLKWLVIDEADKLLDNQYEGFLESLNAEVERPRTIEEQDARERYLRQKGRWEEWRERKIRKVILSATMTKDISKLSTLKLRRPRMMVVRGTESEQQAVAGAGASDEDGVRQTADGFELPRTLVEYSIPVGDGAEKPLVAFELLRTRVLREGDGKESNDADTDPDSDSDDSSSISSGIERDDDDSSIRESSASEDEIDTTLMDPSRKREIANTAYQGKMRAQQAARTSQRDVPTVLVFTSRNESATRLSHLLKGIQPSWSRYITTLIKTTKPRIVSKQSEPAIIVSTDRAARGLDSIAGRPITHVVQYDVPRSVESYVHRVGRTARAGRSGQAWTLVTRAEGKWFNETISGVKVVGISRRTLVEQVKMRMQDEDVRQRYEEVLEGMKDEVYGGGK